MIDKLAGGGGAQRPPGERRLHRPAVRHRRPAG